MAAVKDSYDVSDVESGGGGEEPQPGLYDGKIVSIKRRKQKANGDAVDDLEVVLDIGTEYRRLWTYIQLDNPNVRWKLRELIDAVDAPAKGTIAQLTKKAEGAKVKVKIKAGTAQDGSYRGEVKNLFKPGSETVSDDEATDLANTDEATDYNDWSLDDLKAEVEERGLTVPKGRVTSAKLVALLEEDDAAADGGVTADDDAGEDGEFDIRNVEGFEDWDDWSVDDLKEYAKENEIAVSGRVSEGKLRDAIWEAVAADEQGGAEDGDGSDDAAEDAPEDEYDSFTDQELKDEINDRVKDGAEIKVGGRWTREKAIAALREDDAKDPF